MIVVCAIMFPESAISARLDQGAVNIMLGFGFVFVSGFALVPALSSSLITEAF